VPERDLQHDRTKITATVQNGKRPHGDTQPQAEHVARRTQCAVPPVVSENPEIPSDRYFSTVNTRLAVVPSTKSNLVDLSVTVEATRSVSEDADFPFSAP
jgi:hypothetical protein